MYSNCESECLNIFGIHYDGTSWETLEIGDPEVLDSLLAVWGTGMDDVYTASSNGTMWHYDGTVWTAQEMQTFLYGITGSSADEVYAMSPDGQILHFDGSAWTTEYSDSTLYLSSITALPGGSAFATDRSTGIILERRDGTWTESRRNACPGVTELFAEIPDGAFVGCANGTLLYYNDVDWMPLETGSSSIISIWGSSATDMYAIGANDDSTKNTLYHFDGSDLSTVDLGEYADYADNPGFHTIQGTGPDDVYLAGGNAAISRIIHYDGTSWHSIDYANFNFDFFEFGISRMWALPDGQIFVVIGECLDGEIYQGRRFQTNLVHYDGTTWNWVDTGAGCADSTLLGGAGTDDVYLASSNGYVAHWPCE